MPCLGETGIRDPVQRRARPFVECASWSGQAGQACPFVADRWPRPGMDGEGLAHRPRREECCISTMDGRYG